MTRFRTKLLLGTALAACLAVPLPAFAQTHYRDGTFPGPSVRNYWGHVQAEVMIHGGKIVEVRVLRYPYSHSASRYIASRALPYMEREVIRAQSGRNYGVSGATLDSRSFIASIDGALRQASH